MQPAMIEFRERQSGEVLTAMPLYDFLKMLHCNSPSSEEYPFESLQIIVDGQEVLPTDCGHA
jgi:hypothetical protein